MTKVRAVVWSPRARRDLKDVWRYYARVASVEIADRMLHEIAARATLLERNPLPGQDRQDLRPELRSLLAHPYTLFYRLQGGQAQVARVLHEKRDFASVLSDED
jgi:toxin ParE1/3/4